jgi:hypothetical protein
MTRAWRRCVLSSTLSWLVGCGTNVDLGGGGVDGGMVPDAAVCPAFAEPSTSAPCGACDKSSTSCQPNGCFGGYLCDVSERDCKAPGTPCMTVDDASHH